MLLAKKKPGPSHVQSKHSPTYLTMVEARKSYNNFTIFSVFFFNVDLNTTDKIRMDPKEGVIVCVLGVWRLTWVNGRLEGLTMTWNDLCRYWRLAQLLRQNKWYVCSNVSLVCTTSTINFYVMMFMSEGFPWVSGNKGARSFISREQRMFLD